jgi:hypothetical protein
MDSTQFTEFLQKKKERNLGAGRVDWNRRRQIWLDRVQELITEINGWLLPYHAQGLLDFNTTRIAISERAIGDSGNYEAPMLTITMGAESVTLRPVGMTVIGALGRMDLEGPLGTIKMVLNDTDQKPEIQITTATSFPDKPSPVLPQSESGRSVENKMTGAAWYFVPPDKRQRTMLRVTQDTFFEQLQGLVRP